MQKFEKVALVCCSDGVSPAKKLEVDRLTAVLQHWGMEVVSSPCLYAGETVFSAPAKERAAVLNGFFRDESVDAIFDVSGGDLASQLPPYLDYEAIAASRAVFWGYSDLSSMINAIYTKTGKSSVLFPIRSLVWQNGPSQQEAFRDGSLFQVPVRFLQGTQMEGVVVGGNIRCLLKLAGTPYFPDVTGKILLLEACGGSAARMAAFLSQLAQMEVFSNVSGLLLGTFTAMEQSGEKPTVEEMVLSMVQLQLPVAKTTRIGHGADTRAIHIGGYGRFLV